MKKIEFTPCPMCASTDVKVCSFSDPEFSIWWVKCKDCGLATKHYNDEDKAIGSWNSRSYLPIDLLEKFIGNVERKAEENMIKFGKLEGAHYNAMKNYFNELKNKK